MSRQRIRFANAGRSSGPKRSNQRGSAAETRPPQTPVEAEIESLSLEGRGVARREGKTLFVSGLITSYSIHYTKLYESRRR